MRLLCVFFVPTGVLTSVTLARGHTHPVCTHGYKHGLALMHWPSELYLMSDLRKPFSNIHRNDALSPLLPLCHTQDVCPIFTTDSRPGSRGMQENHSGLHLTSFHTVITHGSLQGNGSHRRRALLHPLPSTTCFPGQIQPCKLINLLNFLENSWITSH